MWLSSNVCVVGRHEKVYFLKSGDCGVLVDCGSEETYAGNMKMLKRDGIKTRMISGLLISHEHFDHVGAVGRAKAEIGCPIISHKVAAGAIETGDPAVTASEADFLGINVPFLATMVDEVVDEGDSVLLGDTEIEIYHIPGHTPGGAAYRIDGNLLVGDTIFLDGGIGWPDIHWGSCLADHRDSINKIADLSPNWVLPGHGEAGRFHRGIAELALKKIEYLERAGVPSMNTSPAPRRSPSEKTRRVELTGIKLREGHREVEPSIRGSHLYEFAEGKLRGLIRPRGQYHGLTLYGADGRTITQPGLSAMNLEHYCSAGKCAPFLPRRVCAKYYEVSSSQLVIRFSPTSDWPLHSTIIYRPGAESGVDVEFSFRFLRSFEAFEAFIASYFRQGNPAYIPTSKGLHRPDVGENVQLFFTGDDSGAEQVLDGRWNWLGDAGLRAVVSPLRYESSYLADWDEESGWALIQMVDPTLCQSVSTNTYANAQDLSIIGRDVAKGEIIKVKTRITYLRVESRPEIDELYGKFVDEAVG